MSRLGGVRQKGRPCVISTVIVASGFWVAGCEYQDGSTQPTSVTEAPASTYPLQPLPSKPAEVETLEAGNRAKLDEVLGVPESDAYLDVTEMISGRMNSFVTRAEIPATGIYTISTACIGTANARVVLTQYNPGGDPVEFAEAFACTEPSSRTVHLNVGGVVVDVINLSPDGSPWGTGAFANLRITPGVL